MKALVLLLILLPTLGCLHATHLGFVVIPNHCVRVTVESFTRPCNQLADGKIMCDHVLVSASCVLSPSKSQAK